MNHYNYKITNIITGEYYIGVRSCKCEIKEDSYMGSSSIWTKLYIKEHRKELVKEILEEYPSRKLANDAEVLRLKQYKGDPLCINKYFDYTPDMTGVKQTPEWIEKRKLFGERNGMFGKHHTEETKKKMSEKLKGRIVSEEAKKKIGEFHKGKINSQETKDKISKANSKIRKITNVLTGEIVYMTLTEFGKLHPECKMGSIRRYTDTGWKYLKTYLIESIKGAAVNSNIDRKSDKNGEPPEVDNPVGSARSE